MLLKIFLRECVEYYLRKPARASFKRECLSHQCWHHYILFAGTPGLEAVSPDYLGQLYDDIQKQALPLKGWDAPELGMSGNTLLKAAATAVNTVRLGACTLFSRLFQ